MQAQKVIMKSACCRKNLQHAETVSERILGGVNMQKKITVDDVMNSAVVVVKVEM